MNKDWIYGPHIVQYGLAFIKEEFAKPMCTGGFGPIFNDDLFIKVHGKVLLKHNYCPDYVPDWCGNEMWELLTWEPIDESIVTPCSRDEWVGYLGEFYDRGNKVSREYYRKKQEIEDWLDKNDFGYGI